MRYKARNLSLQKKVLRLKEYMMNVILTNYFTEKPNIY